MTCAWLVSQYANVSNSGINRVTSGCCTQHFLANVKFLASVKESVWKRSRFTCKQVFVLCILSANELPRVLMLGYHGVIVFV